MKRSTGQLAAALILGLSASMAQAQPLRFVGVPTGFRNGIGTSLSADGSVTAGRSGTGSENVVGPGWTWTASGGRQDLAGPGMPVNTGIYGISGNGQVVVGEAGPTSSDAPAVAYRYAGPGTFQSLGTLPGYSFSRAMGASNDAGVIAGFNHTGGEANSQAFRWTAATVMTALPFASPEHFRSQARDVSRDGTTIVGYSGNFSETRAVAWNVTTGIQRLPSLPGAISTVAWGTNHDGSLVVGNYAVTVTEAIIWRNGVAEALSAGPAWRISRAYAVSDNGSVIVGQLEAGVPGGAITAGIWRQGFGWQPLSTYLTGIGVQVPSGINFFEANSISSDGRTIAGTIGHLTEGTAEGFVVTIPNPPAFIAFVLPGLLAARRR